MLNEFAPKNRSNCSFVIKNVSANKKTIKIFNCPIPYGTSKNLLSIPGVAENEISSSLLKGDLFLKISAREIIIVQSDIELLQFNDVQRNLLQNNAEAAADYSFDINRAVGAQNVPADPVTFTSAQPAYEVGQTAIPSFTATYSEAPATATFVNANGTLTNVSGIGSFSDSASYTINTTEGEKQFSIVASYVSVQRTKTIAIKWLFKRYVGIGANWPAFAGASAQETFIKSLNFNYLNPKSAKINIDAGSADDYIYYAYPTSYGDIDFVFNGLSGGFEKVENSLTITNSYGHSTTYCVWKSINKGLGKVSLSTAEVIAF